MTACGSGSGDDAGGVADPSGAAPATVAGDSSGATANSAATDPPVTIGAVSVVRDEPAAATATIGLAGGTVSAVDVAGTSFELVVPPGSLVGDTDIVMTPADLDGVPFPTSTVMFGPTGLEFIVPATLTITPAADIPVSDQFMYQLNDDASVFLAALPATQDEPIAIEVDHFSGYGVASTDDAGRAALLLKGAADAEAALESRLAAVLGESRRAELLGSGDDVDIGELFLANQEEYVDKVITPRIEAASSSCAATILAVQTVLGFEKKRSALFGTPPEFDVPSLLGATFTPDGACEQEVIAKCKAAKDPAPLIQFWLEKARLEDVLNGTQTDLTGLDERAKKICKPVTYIASGGEGEASFSGAVPSLTAPFVLDVVFTGGNGVYSFNPAADGSSGSIVIEAGGSGTTVTGGGSYTAVENDDGTVTLSTTTNSCVAAVNVCRDGAAVITLTPTE